jgi:hypothetical protein
MVASHPPIPFGPQGLVALNFLSVKTAIRTMLNIGRKDAAVNIQKYLRAIELKKR